MLVGPTRYLPKRELVFRFQSILEGTDKTLPIGSTELASFVTDQKFDHISTTVE